MTSPAQFVLKVARKLTRAAKSWGQRAGETS